MHALSSEADGARAPELVTVLADELITGPAGASPEASAGASLEVTAALPPVVVTAMRRAIELSAEGPAWGVNPQVGCVLLDASGRTLAEGWHRGAGTAHAEVDALSNLLSPEDARGAIAVVTLEPCNHTGRTGPCSAALIAAGVAEVFFAVSDPGRESGGGAERLSAAGVGVRGGVLEREVAASIHPWLTSVAHRRPYVTLKWASSLDGRAAADDGSSQWVSGADARFDVHARRSRSDTIVIGTGTVSSDDPSLTARAGTELFPHQPQPVVVGMRGIPTGARVFAHPRPVLEYPTHDLTSVLDDLFRRGARSAFVEGGPTLASALVALRLVDEFVVYLAPSLLGGSRVALTDLGVATIGDALLLDFVSVDLVGTDLRIVARPAPVDGVPHTHHPAHPTPLNTPPH